MPAKLCLCMNIENQALTQWTGIDANAMAVGPGERLLGIDDDALSILDEGDTDDGAAIAAFLQTGLLDFGLSNAKTLFKVVVNGEANGRLKLTVAHDEANAKEYFLDQANRDLREGGMVAHLARVRPTRNVSLRIGNVDGAMFALDDVEAMVSEKALKR